MKYKVGDKLMFIEKASPTCDYKSIVNILGIEDNEYHVFWINKNYSFYDMFEQEYIENPNYFLLLDEKMSTITLDEMWEEEQKKINEEKKQVEYISLPTGVNKYGKLKRQGGTCTCGASRSHSVFCPAHPSNNEYE